MNWKLILTAVACLLLGLSFSPFTTHRSVSAATTAPAHFQLLSAVVDEMPSGQTDRLVPYNRVFLLDSESGKTWMYETSMTYTKTDGSKEYSPAVFAPVAVVP
jgi:hypothetical protein